MIESSELLELIRRGRRSIVDSRRALLTNTQLMYERDRLRYLNSSLFRDIAELTTSFVIEVERQKRGGGGKPKLSRTPPYS